MTKAIDRQGAVGIDAQIAPGVGARRAKLLCATDLSPESEKAVRRAVRLMQQLDAQLVLLHVIDEA